MQYNTARPWAKSPAGAVASQHSPCHAAGSWRICFAPAFVPQPFNRWHSLFWGSSLPFKRAQEAEEPTTWTRQSPARPQDSAVLPLGTACPAPPSPQHPPRFRWALRQVCSCCSNQTHLFRGLFFSKVLRSYGRHQ